MGVGQLSESDAVDALRLPFYSSSHPTGSHGWRNQFDLGNPDLHLIFHTQHGLKPVYSMGLRVGVLRRRAIHHLARQRLLTDVVAVGGHHLLQLRIALVVGDDVVGDVEASGAPHVLDAVHQLPGQALQRQLWADLG